MYNSNAFYLTLRWVQNWILGRRATGKILSTLKRTKAKIVDGRVVLYALYKFAETTDVWYQFNLARLMSDSDSAGVSSLKIFGIFCHVRKKLSNVSKIPTRKSLILSKKFWRLASAKAFWLSISTWRNWQNGLPKSLSKMIWGRLFYFVLLFQTIDQESRSGGDIFRPSEKIWNWHPPAPTLKTGTPSPQIVSRWR